MRRDKTLKQMSEKLKKISDTGSGERLLLFTEDPQFQELAAQINRLLEDRQNLKADQRRLEQSSRRMLANISHDIKTPMTVLLGYLEIMQTSGQASEEMLRKAEQKARDVMDLIQKFFTLARLESGDLVQEQFRIDVCEICRECILDDYELLTGQDFQVEIRIPETPVWILGNQEALRRILANLISNAVRYGADGHYLGFSLSAEETSVSLQVTDHGKGIDPVSIEHIFDRMYTADDARSQNIQGSGLGLAIAKNLALQLGGDLTCQSTPSVQTTFTLRFPRN